MSSISVTDEELASMKFVLNLVASTEYKDDGLRLEVECHLENMRSIEAKLKRVKSGKVLNKALKWRNKPL